RLGFHAAWNPDQYGQPVTSHTATKFLMDMYPEHVRAWIKRRGGLTRKLMVLSGPELAAMYQTCPELGRPQQVRAKPPVPTVAPVPSASGSVQTPAPIRAAAAIAP